MIKAVNNSSDTNSFNSYRSVSYTPSCLFVLSFVFIVYFQLRCSWTFSKISLHVCDKFTLSFLHCLFTLNCKFVCEQNSCFLRVTIFPDIFADWLPFFRIRMTISGSVNHRSKLNCKFPSSVLQLSPYMNSCRY